MNSDIIIKIVSIEGINPRKDKSMTIRLATLEQSSAEVADMFDLIGQMGVIAIKPDEHTFLNNDLEGFDSIDVDLYDDNKSPSQRIRNVLWRIQEKELGREPEDKEFKEYYRMKTEQIINHLKSKLD